MVDEMYHAPRAQEPVEATSPPGEAEFHQPASRPCFELQMRRLKWALFTLLRPSGPWRNLNFG